MKEMKENETLGIIKRRRSVRSYGEQPISDDDLHAILEAGLYAPNGGGGTEENLSFTVILNRGTLDKLNSRAKEAARKSPLAWLRDLGNNADFDCLYHAPALILISAREDSPCAVYDCSAAAENMLLAAESLGLGGCWLYFPLQAFDLHAFDAEAFDSDAFDTEAFDAEGGGKLLEELNIPRGFRPYTSMIVGYKAGPEIESPPRKAKNVFFIR